MVKTDDESAMGSEAECETFTTLEDGTGGCLLSYWDSRGSGEQTQRVGGEMWLLDTGASGHFTHDSIQLVGYAEYNKTLRCAGGSTYLVVATGFLEIHLRDGDGGGVVLSALLRWDTCQASPPT